LYQELRINFQKITHLIHLQSQIEKVSVLIDVQKEVSKLYSIAVLKIMEPIGINKITTRTIQMEVLLEKYL